MFTDNHTISFEPISDGSTSKSFHEPSVKSVKTDVHCSSLIYISYCSLQVNCTTEWRETCVMITSFTEMNGRGLVSYFGIYPWIIWIPWKSQVLTVENEGKEKSIFKNSIFVKVSVGTAAAVDEMNQHSSVFSFDILQAVLIVHGIYFWLDLRLLPCPAGIATYYRVLQELQRVDNLVWITFKYDPFTPDHYIDSIKWFKRLCWPG